LRRNLFVLAGTSLEGVDLANRDLLMWLEILSWKETRFLRRLFRCGDRLRLHGSVSIVRMAVFEIANGRLGRSIQSISL
jgi:hypothetical protein